MDVPDPDIDEATHGVVTNLSSETATRATWVRAENAVLSTCLDHGQTAYLFVDEGVVERHSESTVETIRSLERIDREVGSDEAVYRATEGDRQTLRSALSVEEKAGPIPVHQVISWRARGIQRVRTMDDGVWRYDSVPETLSSRWLHEPPADLVSDLEAALEPIPATGLFPAGEVELATSKWGPISVTAHRIDCHPDEIITEQYPFSNLDTVLVDTREKAIAFDWQTPRSRARSSLGRVLWGVADRLKESPPERLEPTDEETFERLRDVVSTMATELDYGVEYREL